MDNISMEQRAHDLAILAIHIDAQSKLNGPPKSYNVDVVSSYLQAYNDALDALVEAKDEIRQTKD